MKNDTNTQFANQQNSLMFSKIVGREFQNNDIQVFVSNQHHTLDRKNYVKAKLLIKIKQVLNFRTKTLKAIINVGL